MRWYCAVSVALLIAAGAGLRSGSTFAKKTKPQLCPVGRFLVAPTAEPLLQGVSPAIDAVGFTAQGEVTLDGCGVPTRAKLKATKRFTRITAQWSTCGSFAKARLAAKIATATCDTLTGRLTARKTKAKKFSATRSTCGDARLDGVGGETCDASAANGDQVCPGLCGGPGSATACSCPPMLTTTTTTTTTLPSSLGPPIVATDRQWTWVPFADAFCADGSTTGIGINPSTASSRVLIYFEGGGACWSELTCYTLQTAVNIGSGYGESTFTAEASSTSFLAEPGGFFDRTAAGNPFKDYSFVFIPYCTGDLHGGSNVVTYGAHTTKHVGFQNVAAYLNRLVPTFASADRVYLAGSSSGGFGALLNWGQTHQAFGAVRVDLIDDSGTFMPTDVLSLGNGAEPTQRTQWNLAAALPSGCIDCATSLASLYGFYAGAFPTHRGALLSYTMDSTLPAEFGITTQQFTTGLQEIIASQFTPHGNLKVFTHAGAGHVVWFNPTLATQSVTVEQFLAQMVTDDAGWASVQ